ncbi:hypothetical protein GDO81_014052 [Engystomops pustulosus]|uniref:Uncharacterized protein n=1 Tax=Engystomops pustulosus TaxID=76066 RepID=A0AAV7B7M0_ENGPU|nr:hypothetical protein GDO81_014052 [Engystomops pustulosus]
MVKRLECQECLGRCFNTGNKFKTGSRCVSRFCHSQLKCSYNKNCRWENLQNRPWIKHLFPPPCRVIMGFAPFFGAFIFVCFTCHR